MSNDELISIDSTTTETLGTGLIGESIAAELRLSEESYKIFCIDILARLSLMIDPFQTEVPQLLRFATDSYHPDLIDRQTYSGVDDNTISLDNFEARVIQPVTSSKSIITNDDLGFGGGSVDSIGNFILSNDFGIDDNAVNVLEYLRNYNFIGSTVIERIVEIFEDGSKIGLGKAFNIINGSIKQAPSFGESQIEFRTVENNNSLDTQLSKRKFQDKAVRMNNPVSVISCGNILNRTSTFTEEIWVYIDDVTLSGNIITHDDGIHGWGIQVGINGPGSIRFYTRDLSILSLDTANNLISNKQWNRLSCVYDLSSGTKKIYINKSLITSVTGLTGSLVTSTASLLLGGNGFVGILSDYRSFNTARTSDQIIFNAYLQLNWAESGLDHYLRLNDEYTYSILGFPLALDLLNNQTNDLITSPSTVNAGSLPNDFSFVDADWCLDSLKSSNYPVTIGIPGEIIPILVDNVDNVYMWNDEPSNTEGVISDNGTALINGVNYIVDLNRSVFKLLTAANGQITQRPSNITAGLNLVSSVSSKILSRGKGNFNPDNKSVLDTILLNDTGIFFDGKNPAITVREALDQFLKPLLIFYYPTSVNYFNIYQLSSPPQLGEETISNTAQIDFYLDETNIIAINPVDTAVPVYTLSVGYDHSVVLNEGDIAYLRTSSPTLYDRFSKEYRYIQKDSGINTKIVYENARNIVVNTQLLSKSDANILANLLINILGTIRGIYRVTVSSQGFSYLINNVVSINYPMCSMDNAIFKIVEVTVNGDMETVDLIVWGRLE